MTSLFGLQIQRSVSRSNSVIRTASGCSSISSTNNVSLFRNRPHERRISRSQHRFTSGIRSVSHPTDLATFSTPKKAPLSPRFASRTYTKDEEYEEREEVEDEWADAVEIQEAAPEPAMPFRVEEEFEETEPKFAASFMPYFRKNKPDQFKENEELATDDLNKQALSKYSQAVEGKDTPKGETIRYRLEVARNREKEEDNEPRPYNVADVYREHYIKREKTFFAHLQPSSMRPFGSNDSLFFPVRNAKINYPVFKKFGEGTEQTEDASASNKKSGSSQQREYSTISTKKKLLQHNEKPLELKRKISPTQARDFSNALSRKRGDSAKSRRSEVPQESRNKPLSTLNSKIKLDSTKDSRKDKHKDVRVKMMSLHEPSSTFKAIQSRRQSSQMQATENTSTKKSANIIPDFKQIHPETKQEKKTVKPGSVEEKQVIDRALNFAQKYRDIYLTNEEKSAQKAELARAQPKSNKEDIRVDVLMSPTGKVSQRTTSRLNVLQSSAKPEEVAMLDKKPSKNERSNVPWPAYSETVRKAPSPVSYIRFPNDVFAKQTFQKKTAPLKAESTQARDFSTGLVTRRSVKKVKRLGTLQKNIKNTFLPKALHQMFCSPIPRRRYSEEKSQKQEECDIENLPKLDRPDCPEPREEPMRDCKPLARPKRRKVKRREKCVIKKKEVCPPRADAGLRVKPRKLPTITPGKCNPEKTVMKDCDPLKRLKKVHVPEPPRCEVTAKQICGNRADDDLVPEKKELPILEPEECPEVPPPTFKEGKKLARLKKVDIPEPPKVCKKKATYCAPRADASLKEEAKKLPELEPMECPKVPSNPMKDSPPLPRFKKVDIPEPPKVCPKGNDYCSARADQGLKVESKSLPSLRPLDCPEPQDQPMKDCDPLQRLPKMEPYDPPKCKKVKKFECPPRADEGLKVESKCLPEIVPHEDCKPEKSAMKDCKPLARLPKKHIPHPKCVIRKREICAARADKGMVLERKQLPILEAPPCPVPEPHPMKDVALPRLQKVLVPEPPKVCKVVIECDAVRADTNLKIEQKELPSLEPMECPKVPPSPMKDSKPLPRLAKITIKEPPKICPVEVICPERADEGLKVPSKALPVLKSPKCKKTPSPPMREGAPLPRLPKMEPYDPPKCKRVPKFECPTRADAKLKIKSKSLPELIPHEDCKPKPSKLKDCKPLKRPKGTPVPEPKRCQIIDTDKCSTKRADETLKPKKKQLPVLEAPDCPKVPSRPMKDIKLPRLKKVLVKQPPRVCPKVRKVCPERADAGLKLATKKLPELEAPDCPKVPSKPMKDVKLPRLKKVLMKEPPKICPPEEQCPERADATAGYKIKKKPLRTVILSRKHNKISFRQFKKGKKKNTGRQFSTKQQYSLSTNSHVMSRSFSNRVYFTLSSNRPRKKLKGRPVPYRLKSECYKPSKKKQQKECPSRPQLCPPKKEEPKSMWQKVCDYFKARPGCPAPDEWKKKLLREKAEKAAKAAGLHLCECPCVGKPQIKIKKKGCGGKKKKSRCPKFKMPYCSDQESMFCDKQVTPIECDPPRQTPYPSFSEWQREMKARKMSECKVAEKRSKEMKGQINALKKRKKKKKKQQSARCYSTMSNDFFWLVNLQKERTAKIIEELDKELNEQINDDVKLFESCDVPNCKQSI